MLDFVKKLKEQVVNSCDEAIANIKASAQAPDSLVSSLKKNFDATVEKSKVILAEQSQKCSAALESVKNKYAQLKEEAEFQAIMNSAKPVKKEKLSFEAANGLTLQIAEQINSSNQDNATRLVIAAVEVIARTLAQIRENLSDPDYASLGIELKILETANLDNLAVARRMADKRLYAGLLGEFSCGKSTFINALIEEKFLHEDALQGTTCAKTVLTYAEKENIRVIFDNDTCIDMRTAKDGILLDADKKREFIRKVTADEKTAASIREVICEMPNPVLTNGLVIVDTPGIGSINPRHNMVTAQAMQGCDAVIVLTTLSKPLSNELVDSVIKLVGANAPNCIFIGTRKDQLPQKELPRQKKHFQRKLTNIFNRECQFEFVSAYQALQELAGEAAPPDSLKDFRDFRDRIKTFLETNRRLIQTKKTQILINDIIVSLDKNMENHKAAFAAQIREYQEQVIAQDSNKWRQWQKDIEQEFNLRLKEIQTFYKIKGSELAANLHNEIKSRILGCDDTSQLKDYLSSGINATIATFKGSIENSTRNFIYDPLQKELKASTKEYNEKFKKEYEKIARIFGQFMPQRLATVAGKNLKISAGAANSDYGSLAQDIDSEENFKIGGGLATGIGISLLVPGVGWLVGGALTMIGGILGAGLLKSLQKRKEEALDKVDESMASFEQQLLSGLEDAYNGLAPQFKAALAQTMEDQKKEYSNIIEYHNQYIEKIATKLAASTEFISKKINILKEIGASMVDQENLSPGEKNNA